MYLVVGLGNPGKQYEATRHNMGFDTVDRLVEDYNVPQGGVKFNAMYGKTLSSFLFSDQSVFLCISVFQPEAIFPVSGNTAV